VKSGASLLDSVNWSFHFILKLKCVNTGFGNNNKDTIIIINLIKLLSFALLLNVIHQSEFPTTLKIYTKKNTNVHILTSLDVCHYNFVLDNIE
jgi:hypothetical protein